MNILYWNVCNAAGNEDIRQETEGLILEHDIDIACLQEVPYEEIGTGHTDPLPLSARIASELGYHAVFSHTRTIWRTSKRINGYGTAVLSRSGLVDFTDLTTRDDRFSYMTPHHDNRRALLTLRTLDDPEVTVGVSHMSYPLPIGIGRVALRREQGNVIDALQGALQRGEVVFGGDLNHRPGTCIDHRLEGIGLSLVSDASFPTFRSRHWYAGYTQRNLDRVYASNNLSAETVVLGPRQSDHNPLIVSVSK